MDQEEEVMALPEDVVAHQEDQEEEDSEVVSGEDLQEAVHLNVEEDGMDHTEAVGVTMDQQGQVV